MNFRAPALVLTMLAVIAQALVSAPAQAADYELFVKSKTIAITPGGQAEVERLRDEWTRFVKTAEKFITQDGSL